jgi:predicted RNase H-like HicB family nuclease
MTERYLAFMDGKAGAYGISFPDLPGCVAMGATPEEALAEATDVLFVWIADAEARGQRVPSPTPLERAKDLEELDEMLADGAVLVSVPLIRTVGKTAKANLSIDVGVLAAIDAAAERNGINRSAMVERLARQCLAAAG